MSKKITREKESKSERKKNVSVISVKISIKIASQK